MPVLASHFVGEAVDARRPRPQVAAVAELPAVSAQPPPQCRFVGRRPRLRDAAVDGQRFERPARARLDVPARGLDGPGEEVAQVGGQRVNH